MSTLNYPTVVSPVSAHVRVSIPPPFSMILWTSLPSFILEQQYHSLPPTQTMITHRPLLSLVTALSLLGVALFYLHVCCHRPPKKLKRPPRNAAIRKQQRARGQPQNNVRRRGRQEQGGAGSSSGTGTDSVDQSHSEPESSKDK